MQLELWEKPVFWGVVEFICVVEGKEGKSFKQVATAGCFEDLMVNNGVQSSRSKELARNIVQGRTIQQ